METIKKYLFEHAKRKSLGYEPTKEILEMMYSDLKSGNLSYSDFQDACMNLVSPLNKISDINNWNNGLDRIIFKIDQDEDEKNEEEVLSLLKKFFDL